MIVFPLHHVTRCLKCPYLISTRRAFRVSSTRYLISDEKVAIISDRRVTKTKKKFSDLPKAHILPDGSSAIPLGEWRGGSEKRKAPRRFTAWTPSELEDSKLSLEAIERCKERVENVESLEENSSNAHVVEHRCADESFDQFLMKHKESTAKPKRRRKLKAETAAMAESTSTPKNDASTKAAVDTIDLPVLQQPRPQKAKVVVESIMEDDGQPRNMLAKEILENLNKFPHCLLLTRVGQFYESYFDQAIEISRLLNIKLTTRKWDGRHISMCGFPLIHLDKHLKVLVQQHKRFVAMCEEFPRYSNSGVKEFDRRVVRIITPGTLIDEPFLNQYENNYLLAISYPALNERDREQATNNLVGLAWIDVSTGEFFSKPSTYEGLRDDLTRIGPQEVVVDKRLQLEVTHPICQALTEEGLFVSFITPPETVTRYDPSDGQEGGEIYLEEPARTRIEDGAAEMDMATGTPISQVAVEGVSKINTSEVPIAPPPSNIQCCTDDLIDQHQHTPFPTFTPHETSAINLLATYLNANLLEHMPTLSLPNREGTDGRMQIDSHTIKALEIREGVGEGGIKGSLLSVIKRTITGSGTRLLTRWLCSPSTSMNEINARQSLVSFFHARPHFRADLLRALGNSEDASRIVQKFLLGRGDSSDLLSINTTIRVWSAIKKHIDDERYMESKERSDFNDGEWTSLDALMSRMTDLRDLSSRIGMALEKGGLTKEGARISDIARDKEEAMDTEIEQGSPKIVWRYGNDKWVIKPEFSEKLMVLHTSLKELLKRREELEDDLRQRYDAPSLTLRSSPAQGMHVHLAKYKRDQAKINKAAAFVSIAETGSTKCYFNQEWSQLGAQIVETTVAIFAAEKEAFEILRSEVSSHASLLRRNARILDELDVTLAFANLAGEMNFVRPLLKDDTSYDITNGRHPTVELGLLTAGRVFTPNSVQITPASRFHIITGPNMAGKSTLLRQTALIAILAQTGSFVPADSAVLGIVDKLFSRVGAKDDLFQDRSTFMVEMLETAEILRRATPKSLVIMDEVGRGTTVKDGLAIAFATVHHLVSVNRCRTLFATHFHELADMLGYSNDQNGYGIFENVSFFCTDIDETEDGRFAYSYRVRPGVNRDSHGLKVAQLAGMPPPAMAVAQDVLFWLKNRHQDGVSDATEHHTLGQSLTQPRTH